MVICIEKQVGKEILPAEGLELGTLQTKVKNANSSVMPALLKQQYR